METGLRAAGHFRDNAPTIQESPRISRIRADDLIPAVYIIPGLSALQTVQILATG
jgi:hypothetical protein